MLVGAGNSGDGGAINIVAGETKANAKQGGHVHITAGLGSSTSTADGGNGGDMALTGGRGLGGHITNDIGGKIDMYGGQSDSATGGAINIGSGFGVKTSSGNIKVHTASSGPAGVSGKIDAFTGSSVGTSGLIKIQTGQSTAGTGGDIDVIVGSGVSGDGGDIYMSAGLTTAANKEGGDFEIKGGTGAGLEGGSGGEVHIYGGHGQGTTLGYGGDIQIKAGTGQSESGGIV
jgi:hypothetical protein